MQKQNKDEDMTEHVSRGGGIARKTGTKND